MNPITPSRRHVLAAAGLLGTGLLRADDPPLAPPDRQPPGLKLPDVPERKVGWAVVGLGQLVMEEIMGAFGACRLSRPTTLVSGHPDKARRVAAAYGVNPKNIYTYENYDDLRNNPDVDVVYICLPNSMHAEYTVRGLKAGKHVLCEKPMATSAAECERMIAAAGEAKKKLMIAYRLHYEPYNRTAMDLCGKRAVGDLRTFSSSNCQVVKAPNIRLSKALGGGPVQDIGIYSINAAGYTAREEPAEVTAFASRPAGDPQFREVPASVSFELRFQSGLLAHCDCSFDAAESRRYRVHGTDGFIDADPAFAYRGLRLSVGRAGKTEEIKLTEVNQFASEMDHFSACVLNGREPLTPGAEGLADVRVIAAIEEAARSGRAVTIKG
jgi:predicted dehydrogenase